SSPDFGPVDAGGGGGLEASADRAGNAAIAFTQGDATGRRVVVALYDLAPRAPSARNDAAWHRQPFPRLHWSTVTDTWSAAVQYRLEIDHVAVSVQGGTTFRPAAALPDGDHVWRIVTTDARGQETVGADRPLRIDTVRPVVVLKAPPRARKGARVAVTATVSDAAPGSGVARVLVDFGDGSVASSLRTHRYLRAGRFTVRATVVDGAGNTAVAVARVKVK
ncbi:MAG: hypothetical protein QOD53_270, partial [Thermoleophilaceae bacterium]|nr:hypothetical protein [Thermoleophilaceae bacterium]